MVRSTSWIFTEYNNQSSPSTFYAMGSETTLGSNSPPNAPSQDSPLNNVTGTVLNPIFKMRRPIQRRFLAVQSSHLFEQHLYNRGPDG